MCGIAGFIDSSLSSTDAQSVLGKMLISIAHRGPDARSSYSDESLHLGHNRLSIIDLSEQANQPMHYDDCVMIFNGEMYNYLEVRKKLIEKKYFFKTQSDTEVVLAAYKEWGSDCVKEFIGMWAFVIWDKNKKELFASRDRFGIKPFYYILEGNKFYFGSEYKALKQSPLFKNDLNLDQISRGLQMGWVCYNDETYFEKIKSLPAATSLKLQTSNFKLQTFKYWDIETGKYSELSFDEKKEKFLSLFTDSIKLHMRSDVPVASCLSGGLDSSAIVSMVQELNPGMKYKSFSIFYEGKDDVDERPFIYEVIKKYPAVEPYYFSPTDMDVEESFHHALFHADVPCTGSSFISQYFLMKLIGQHKIKVVLDGQGSDEYLAGYMHTFYRVIADLLKAGNVLGAINLTSQINKKLNSSFTKTFSHFGKSLLSVFNNEQSLYSFEYKNYHPFLSNVPSSKIPFQLEKQNGNNTDNFLYQLIFNTSLPSLLHYEDRNSMAFSVESRVPFLDHRLVEFAFQLKTNDKANKTETKYILRKSLHGILPESIENRKDKKGFVTPGENKWLRGPLKHLLEINFNKVDFLKKEIAIKILNDYKSGDNSKAILVWRMAVLNYWVKNFC
ncbi:MAG: asparagine synthase (glutamine-hydrolyzing) [Bacteroidota bacterium]